MVDYNLTALRGLLRAVAVYRQQIVQTFYDLGQHAIEQGQRGGPFAFIISSEQHDPHATAKLEELLLQGVSKFIARWRHSEPMANRIRLAATSSCWRNRFARMPKR
mgnify:CR=1 FL=1